MILKKKINFLKYETFLSKKLSANSANTSYTNGLNKDVLTGEPDVMWQSICFIKDVLKIWTGGLIYNCADVDIDDDVVSDNTTWSSSKITSLFDKINIILDSILNDI